MAVTVAATLAYKPDGRALAARQTPP